MLAVAIGEFFGGGAFNIINFLYPGFLALTIGLPPHLAGIVMLIARVFDAVIDPLIGFFSDKLRVRFGTRRGGLLVSAPLTMLALFLMFYPYDNPSIAIRFGAVMISYIFFCAVQSSVMIPYYSLASEITDDYIERARMTTLRLGFSIFASIVCVALPQVIVNIFEENSGYIAMSLIFGAIFMFCIIAVGLFAREGMPPPEKAELFALSDFLRPFKLKSFRQYLYIFLCCQITMAIMSTLFFFYVDFYFCRSLTAAGMNNMVGMIGAALMFGMQIFALPFYLKLVKKTGKTIAYIIGAVIWIVGALFLLIIPADANPVLLYVLAAVIGFGISGPGLIPHAMLPDVIDVGSLKYGARAAGIFSGASNMVIQLGQAIMIAIVMFIIGAAGFIEQDIREGAEKVVSQSLSAQNTIIVIMAGAPLLFMSMGIFFCTRYRLSKERHEQVVAALGGNAIDNMSILEQL
jgi:oligogalacturonide transporter